MNSALRLAWALASLVGVPVCAAQVAQPGCTVGPLPTPSPGDVVHDLEVHDAGAGPVLHVAVTIALSPNAAKLRRWNGAGFTDVPGTSSTAWIVSLCSADLGAGSLLFAGQVGTPGVRAWNGASWSNLGAGLDLVAPAHPFDELKVNVIAACDLGNGPELYVAGRFDRAGGVVVADIAKWNGSSWSAVPSPGPDIFDLLAFDDGSGTKLFCAAEGGLSTWNGTMWRSTGVNSEARRLCVYDSGAGPQLFATARYGTPLPGYQDVGVWNGSSWTRLNMPAPGFDVLGGLGAFDDGSGSKLYVVIDLWMGAGSRRLASYDGVSWNEIGSPPNSFDMPVTALREFDDGSGPALFVGGVFGQVFGRNQRAFARFGCLAPPPPSTFCTPTSPTSQGCAATISASGHPDVAHSAPCTITATSIDGQRNGLFLYGVSGQSAIPWCVGSANLLCVAPPRQRMSLQNSGGAAGACNGTLFEDWNAYQLANPQALGNPWSTGATVDLQGWFRDPGACKASSLSEGVRLVYQP